MAANKFVDMDFKDAWQRDDDCCWFASQMQRITHASNGKPGWQVMKERIKTRDLLFDNPRAFEYAGWYLTNVTYDLFPDKDNK